MINVEKTKKFLEKNFHNSQDIIYKNFVIGKTEAMLVYVDGMSDKELLERCIMTPLNRNNNIKMPYFDWLDEILNYPEAIKKIDTIKASVDEIVGGDIALFIEGAPKVYMISLRNYLMRSVQEPPTSQVIKGPREGFIEDMKMNMVLLRRKLRTKDLVFEKMKIGTYTQTNVAIAYIDGIADKKVVKKIRDRLKRIKIDGILDSSYLAWFLEERKFSIFKQTGSTEKPDVLASRILEGKVAIICDGSPLVLTYPYALIEDLQSGQDYYTRASRSSLLRILRVLGIFISVVLPALYVSLQEYHYQVLPLKFLETIINATSNLPLKPSLEMLFVVLLFEVLNEASVRMPTMVGMALSVVGAIILGDTAVKAGIISSPAVLITALSAIGMYSVPDQVGTTSILRIAYIVIASVLGLYGLLAAIIITVGYVASFNSYGTPYLAPYAPIIADDKKDGLLKANLLQMNKRPIAYHTENKNRQG